MTTGIRPPSSADLSDLRARIHDELADFLATSSAVLAEIGSDLDPMADAIAEFLLTGGKRLRPAFCYWGWRGAGGPDCDEIVRAAAALEMLQACALIHDDVMDASDSRRGRPAVHRRFSKLHRRRGWQGDADHFGESAAILLGDLALIWADQMLNTCGLPEPALRAAAPAYDLMRVELMAGQYLDLLEQVSGPGSVESALRVARYKSAKYTIERPLHMGAALAGATPALLATYTGYGLPLGEAFQLRDDVLGVFGDPDVTGKPAGDDLREGKRTAMVALALSAATPAQAEIVQRHLGNPELDPTGVEEMRTVLTDTGALASVERLVDDLLGRALDALSEGPVEPEARDVLERLAYTATARVG